MTLRYWGDLNAEVGMEPEYLGTIGRHSLQDESNGNGERLIDFAISKNMVTSLRFFLQGKKSIKEHGSPQMGQLAIRSITSQ